MSGHVHEAVVLSGMIVSSSFGSLISILIRTRNHPYRRIHFMMFFNVIPSFWRNGLDEFIKIYWNSDLHYLSIKVSMFLSKPGMFSLPKLLPIPMYSWRKTYYFVKALWEQSTDICSIKEPEKGWGGQNAYVFKVHNLVKEDLTDNNEDNLEATMTCSWGKVIRRKCDRCDLQKVAGI